MSGKTISLIGSSSAALCNDLIPDVLACWAPESERPGAVSLTFEQVVQNEQSLDKCGMAWLHLDGLDAPGLYAVLGLLQDRHLSAMITRPGEDMAMGAALHEGIVVAPPAAPVESLAAIMRTLWSQAGVVRSLQREIRVLRAHQGGLSDQIGKIDEELRLAAQLQREFLPEKLPNVGPIEFKVLYRPAGYVSGDIYDVLRLDEDHVGFFIADAVGHGVPAALMTMYIKRALRTKEVDNDSPNHYRLVPPDEALAHLNQDMVQHQGSGKIRFATACYGVLNHKTLEMRFARAGHPFPLLLHADGSIEHLSPDGGMLGIFPEEVFEMARVQLRPGDRLLLYSDGFEMAFPTQGGDASTNVGLANEQYTEEFRRLAHGPLEDALHHLVEQLDQATGSLNQQDDMTVVCVGVSADAVVAVTNDAGAVVLAAD